jgi:hypothetical protein
MDDSSLAAPEDKLYTIDHYGGVEVETIKFANGTVTSQRSREPANAAS